MLDGAVQTVKMNLSETLAARRTELAAEINAYRTDQPIVPSGATKESFLARLRQFFEL